MQKINDILQFWFHDLTDADTINSKQPPAKNWFMKSNNFDQEIKERFEQDILNASKGNYQEWENVVEGRMALVILFDQFTRNIFRNTEQMFAYDALALDLVKRTIEEGLDKKMMCVHRVFLYMPLMHAENIDDQQCCVDQFTQLIEDSKTACPHNTGYFEYNLKFANQHLNVIKQFGRFPHRNKILGRESTSEEKENFEKHGGF